jgi:hypothetical protein
MTDGQKIIWNSKCNYMAKHRQLPENPRVVFNKAEFEIGSAKFWGTDTKPMCAQIEKLSDLLLLNQKHLHQMGFRKSDRSTKNCK